MAASRFRFACSSSNPCCKSDVRLVVCADTTVAAKIKTKTTDFIFISFNSECQKPATPVVMLLQNPFEPQMDTDETQIKNSNRWGERPREPDVDWVFGSL